MWLLIGEVRYVDVTVHASDRFPPCWACLFGRLP